jgi:hypothetical protein
MTEKPVDERVVFIETRELLFENMSQFEVFY